MPIHLKVIQSPCPNFTLIDLPGITHNAADGEIHD
jgi:predicted secreted protein